MLFCHDELLRIFDQIRVALILKIYNCFQFKYFPAYYIKIKYIIKLSSVKKRKPIQHPHFIYLPEE